jgi:hypothetical protein
MRVKSLLLAFLLAAGLASAADQTQKPRKVKPHAVSTPKAAKHTKENAKGVVHKSPKVAKHKTSTPKTAKHKVTKYKKHKA